MRNFFWGSTKRKVATVGVVLLVVAMAAAGGGSDSDTASPADEAADVTTTVVEEANSDDGQVEEEPTSNTEAPSTTASTTTTSTTQPTTTTTLPVIGAGTYLVGSEVEPGVYRASRYWARLDETGEIIDNDLIGDGFGIVVIQPSDAFIEFTGEAIAVDDFPAVDPIAMGYEGGTYLVGIDIEPGTYRVTATDGTAYAARLDNTLDIIDNDLNEGSVIIVVQLTDFALSFSGGPLENIG
ncbi:MAG: hypothetical protein GY925_26075 [Actinomycetia bacterium]|nr:hypothetical protein [Actinomycetes bacterium]